jgi:hypothetical protein
MNVVQEKNMCSLRRNVEFKRLYEDFGFRTFLFNKSTTLILINDMFMLQLYEHTWAGGEREFQIFNYLENAEILFGIDSSIEGRDREYKSFEKFPDFSDDNFIQYFRWIIETFPGAFESNNFRKYKKYYYETDNARDKCQKYLAMIQKKTWWHFWQ